MAKNYWKVLCLISFLFAFSNIFAQTNLQDVIYLNNGSIIRGVILEQVINDYIKIQIILKIFPIARVVSLRRSWCRPSGLRMRYINAHKQILKLNCMMVFREKNKPFLNSYIKRILRIQVGCFKRTFFRNIVG